MMEVQMAVNADQVKKHIVRHLKWDNSLKGSKIEVDYIGRTAVLTGTVPSLTAYEMALRDAQSIPGVDFVENRLSVEFDHNHPNKTDQELKKDIVTIIGCAADIDANNIRVSVVDGIVTLKGNIDAYWKRTRLEDLVSSLEGVLELKNQVRVLPADKAPDFSIKKDIISALERMEVYGLENLKVQVKNGKVTVSGSVPTWDVALAVEDTARFTAGVVGVKNAISVE